jgi:general nucleoside transport system permease protein
MTQATLQTSINRPEAYSKLRSWLDEAVVYLIAIVVALGINSIFIAIAGGDVLTAYESILRVSLGNSVGVAQTLNKWTPLLLGSLAIALGVRGGLFNIGVDGQLYMGALSAAGAAFSLGSSQLSPFLLVPIVLIAGAIGGGLYAGIAGVLKARYGVTEIFVTVMLTLIATYFTQYMTLGPWNDPVAGEAITVPLPAASYLPMLIPSGGGHAGILVALAFVVIMYIFLNKSVLGFKIRAMGDNAQAARLGGISSGWMTVFIMVASGFLAGLGGAIEVTGLHHRVILGLSSSYGIMSVLICNVGRNNPIGIMVASFFFAVLFVGSDSLQRSVGLPIGAVLVFQAVVFLSILVARSRREMRKN